MEITSFSKTIDLKACIYFNQHYSNFHQGYLKPVSCHLSAFWLWNTIFWGCWGNPRFYLMSRTNSFIPYQRWLHLGRPTESNPGDGHCSA